MNPKKTLSKIKIFKVLFVLAIMNCFLLSCTVTNNLYVNDPVPINKNTYSLYGGVGMGLAPTIDSVSNTGEVFSSDLFRTYNLSFGGKFGITNKFSLGGSIHLPRILGGVGLNIRPQLSLFHKDAIFNAALVGDFGAVIPKDSIKIFGSTSPLEIKTKGALNADFSLPVSFKLGDEIRLIITPRYSFNAMYLRKEFDSEKRKSRKISYPAISMGFKLKSVFLESSLIQWNNKQIWVFGIVYFFRDGKAYSNSPGI